MDMENDFATLTKVMLTVERIEGKLERMDDRLKLNEERIEALLRVVTGQNGDGRLGLIVRVHDLEQQMVSNSRRLEDLDGVKQNINSIEKKVDRVLELNQQHPTILYLLRYDTRKTVAWILIIFAILSLLWVSELREALLSLLGI